MYVLKFKQYSVKITVRKRFKIDLGPGLLTEVSISSEFAVLFNYAHTPTYFKKTRIESFIVLDWRAQVATQTKD